MDPITRQDAAGVARLLCEALEADNQRIAAAKAFDLVSVLGGNRYAYSRLADESPALSVLYLVGLALRQGAT